VSKGVRINLLFYSCLCCQLLQQARDEAVAQVAVLPLGVVGRGYFEPQEGVWNKLCGLLLSIS